MNLELLNIDASELLNKLKELNINNLYQILKQF
jgi:hypothetical protein